MKFMKSFLFSLLLLQLAGSLFANNNYLAPTDIVRAYFSAADAGNVPEVAKLLTDDCWVSAPFLPQATPKNDWLEVLQSLKIAFPDMKHDVVDVLETGRKVAVRGVASGQNKGMFMGNPPTGNRFSLSFNTIFELDKSGKIKAIYVQFDQKSLESQLMAGLPDPKKVIEHSIRALYDAMDAGQVEKFGQYCSSDFTISNPFLPGPSPIGAFQGVIQAQKGGFPDMKHEVIEIVTDGKTATTRGIFRGTNTGSMMGNPPTGNKVNLSFLVFDELDAQGKIRNRHVQFDSKSFEMQLLAGITPPNNKQVASDIMAALYDRNLDGVISHCAPDARFYGWGPEPTDASGYRRAMSELLAAFPDARFTVQDVVADGDNVSVRHLLEGAHTGAAFQNIPKTNRKVTVPATVTFHFKNGKATDLWLNADMLGLILQLGGNPMAGGN